MSQLQVKQLLDVLYINKNEDIESVKALSEMGVDSAQSMLDAYVKIKSLNRAAIGTSNHDNIINVVTSYPDQSYRPDTFGEFLFGCIDVDISDVEESCRPECKDAIIRNEQNYKRCVLPVWKLDNNDLTQISDGNDGSTRGLIFVTSSTTDINVDVLPSQPTTLELYHLDNQSADRFIQTYRDREPVSPSLGPLGDNSASKKVRFQLPDTPSPTPSTTNSVQSPTPSTKPTSTETPPSTQSPTTTSTVTSQSTLKPIPSETLTTTDSVQSSTTSTLNDSNAAISDPVESTPTDTDDEEGGVKVRSGGIQQWIILGAMILLLGLGLYFLYRQWSTPLPQQPTSMYGVAPGYVGASTGTFRTRPSVRLNQI